MPLPPILFVHGDFADARLSWSRQWSSLSTKTKVLLADRRGHGESPVGPLPYTIHGDALDLLSVVHAHCPGERVAVVAHSYGALAAWEMARMRPELIHSLHLIEPPYLSLLPENAEVRRLSDETRALQAQAPRLSDEELTSRFFAMVAGEEAVAVLRAKPVWASLVSQARRFAHEEFAGDYPARYVDALPASLRTVFYSGGRSHPALRRIARELHERIPGSRLHLFPEAGHDVQRLSEPFESALLSHLEGPSQRARGANSSGE